MGILIAGSNVLANYRLNGSASLISSSDLQLTPSGGGTGSAWFPTPIMTLDGLAIVVQSNCAGAADGFTFGVIDVAQEGLAALGGNGDGAGWQGLAGGSLHPSEWNSYLRFDYGAFPGQWFGTGSVTVDAHGTHTYEVRFARTATAGTYLLSGWMDGSLRTTANVPIPGNSTTGWYFGMTAATGGSLSNHDVYSYGAYATGVIATFSVADPTGQRIPGIY